MGLVVGVFAGGAGLGCFIFVVVFGRFFSVVVLVWFLKKYF